MGHDGLFAGVMHLLSMIMLAPQPKPLLTWTFLISVDSIFVLERYAESCYTCHIIGCFPSYYL